MQNKFAWISTPDELWEDKKEMITTALESGIDHVLDFDDIEEIRKLGNVKIIANNDDADIYLVGINGEGDGFVELKEDFKDSTDIANAKKAKSEGKTVCAYIKITDKAHEQLAVKLGSIVDYIILVGTDWTIIPLENIIADLQKLDVEIIAAVRDVDGARVALETLEHGTDGIIFEANDFNNIKKIAQNVLESSNANYELKLATVTNVKSLGTGDRVCVDTTDMMSPGEGMLVGSYSKSLFLIHSESLESEYVASRPFRVNAGPVQAYVMVPGNKTRYLSELVAGDEVLIVNTKGETRTAYVGRSKIERRPLLLIEAEYEGKTIRTILQNAETIRIVDANDEPLSVADVKPGDKVKVYIETNARHFGIAIDETIIEQ
ncbi:MULTISPECIES: 3-dehydroquinate synthase II [Methanobrevibacter]|uniref:3-dehydroquinate synthase II n=1 Tax=Methanobrevibacter TaxID=2172 RepID=UPI0015BA6A4C|nr:MULTISPECIES: 3-dehydroquinate synthase II [Methanobrevibacter]MBS7257753.1 3-dehydroquinate synthase II [Methanobrevibacter sp.]MCI7428611.1 3-dehydroquinate synthase II [Methanobrevibacter sp.]MDD6776755.1 3-dehydroquinate synthase II [Methanobacteriaceae archaeon]MDY3097771.1 3-dehydroquinate synthase II [Methanobrevibacter sp.]